MKCQNCGKYDAVTHITEVLNGIKSEIYLCKYCSKKNGSDVFDSIFNTDFENFFGGLWQNPKLDFPVSCKNCKSTLKDIKATGRLGCGECYETFFEQLQSLLKEIHGSNVHKGKIPKRIGHSANKSKEIELLKKQLEKAVLEQNFEEAAILRDRILEIEK